MSRKPEIATPPASFIQDLTFACPTVAAVQRRCGVSVSEARRLLNGDTLAMPTLDAAMQAFYDKDSDMMIPLQLETGKMSRKRKDKVIALIRAAAKFVEDYANVLKISVDERKYWVFPPKDTLLRFVKIREDLRDMLWLIWRQCPNKRKLFFKDAPLLWEQFSQESLDYRIKASATTRKALNKARKAARKATT